MKIGCVVMAAGKSVRFGKNKLLVPLDGKPLLAHVLNALVGVDFARTVVVTSDADVSALCRAHGVDALQYAGGPQSETVRLGISRMDDLDGCLFMQGDQPLCTRASIERLLQAFYCEPDVVHRLSFAGNPGSPVIFPSCIFFALRALSGECGGMAAARKTRIPVRFVEAESAAELLDADTEKALSEIEKIYFSKSL